MCLTFQYFQCIYSYTCIFDVQVRIENIKTPEDYIEPMLQRAKKEYMEKTYHIHNWTDHEDFLGQYAKRSGKLRKVNMRQGSLWPFTFFRHY